MGTTIMDMDPTKPWSIRTAARTENEQIGTIMLLVDSNTFVSSTEGTVFVETPQMYTGEKLVKERFVQKSRLREGLKEEPEFSPLEIIAVTYQKEDRCCRWRH